MKHGRAFAVNFLDGELVARTLQPTALREFFVVPLVRWGVHLPGIITHSDTQLKSVCVILCAYVMHLFMCTCLRRYSDVVATPHIYAHCRSVVQHTCIVYIDIYVCVCAYVCKCLHVNTCWLFWICLMPGGRLMISVVFQLCAHSWAYVFACSHVWWLKMVGSWKDGFPLPAAVATPPGISTLRVGWNHWDLWLSQRHERSNKNKDRIYLCEIVLFLAKGDSCSHKNTPCFDQKLHWMPCKPFRTLCRGLGKANETTTFLFGFGWWE